MVYDILVPASDRVQYQINCSDCARWEARGYKLISATNKPRSRNPRSTPAIRFHRLSKRYGKNINALNDLTLDVTKGEVFGFLGPNGAGKTTTIRLILDLIRPTSGTVSVFGQNCNGGNPTIRQSIGYLPGDLHLYNGQTGHQIITLFSSLHSGGIQSNHLSNLVDRLNVQLHRKVGDLSQGNRQKIGLILALMTRADLLILDEPTNGLDPLAQRQLLTILHEMREQGSTIFFSSHNLPEVERICDRVGIIRNGDLISIQYVKDITSQRMTRIHLQFGNSTPPNTFTNIDGVREIYRDSEGYEVRLEVRGEPDLVIKRASKFHVTMLESEQPDLEETFLALYTEAGEEEGS
jgi:ABC-2 type transport system ATP-binding protein